MDESRLEEATEKIAPSGYQDETRRYLRRILKSEDSGNRVELMLELGEIIHKTPEQIVKVLYDINAEHLTSR